jgi:XRE family aerobic/anaerobic benzoate catabolism transcriptional regulator
MEHRGEAEVIRRVGARVRHARAERRLTMREVAERSGISLRFLSQLEAGDANIAIGRLAAVATALGVSLADLVAEDAPAASRDVALLGLRGAGKSTIGPRLAEALGAPVVELDERIEEAAGLRVAEIFSLHGEGYYRRLERECLEAVLDDGRPSVVALSGGIVHNEEAFGLARRRCATVWLKARPEDHMRRVLDQGDRRPVANRPDAMAELRAILAAREPLYGLADVTVDTSRVAADDAVRDVLHALGRSA